MNEFERPGGFRLVLDPKVEDELFEDASSHQEFLEAKTELERKGRRYFRELPELDQEIRELAREQRQVELRLNNAYDALEGPSYTTLPKTERERKAEEAIPDLKERLNELITERKELEERRSEKADLIARYFVSVSLNRDMPDLSPPDVDSEMAKVGEPVGHWSLP